MTAQYVVERSSIMLAYLMIPSSSSKSRSSQPLIGG
jgi:hypothetical protein